MACTNILIFTAFHFTLSNQYYWEYYKIWQGAPERIISLCTKIAVGDDIIELDDHWKKVFNDTYETLGGMGERVIGMLAIL